MTFSTWLTFFAAGWMISLSPGAGAISCMSAGMRYGYRRGVWNILGLQSAIVLLIAIVALGLGAVLAASLLAFNVIKWLGVAYLVWLGIQQWRSETKPLQVSDETAHALRQLFVQGFLVNASNPKGIIFMLAVLPQFIGPQMQVPPMYSAIKLNGQPLYKLAREGVTVERKARPIEIYSITYGGSPAENEYVLDVTCSKGTYIRTLLEDIAAAMGQKGTMSALRRTSAGVYTEADAHTLEEILAAKEQGMDALEALMLPVESVFESLPLLVVEPWVEHHLYNGCPTSHYRAQDGKYRVYDAAGTFLGLANVTQGVLQVEKIFCERA